MYLNNSYCLNISMQVINRLDDGGRFYGLKFFDGDSGQINSNGYSYLQGRKSKIEIEEYFNKDPTMGLERHELDALYRGLDNGLDIREFVSRYMDFADKRSDVYSSLP